MTIDCQWVEKNIEALFCDGLNEEDARLARDHIQGCASCGREVQALHAIDPLVRIHFRRELGAAARRPRLHHGRLFVVTGAAAFIGALLFAIALHAPQPGGIPSIPPETQASVQPAESPLSSKADPGEVARAKPSADAGSAPDRTSPSEKSGAAGAGLEFLAVDAAGYAHTLEEYRGHVVVIGVWSPGQAASIEQIERLYKTFGANPKLRFLGVTNESRAKPAHTTFPVLYNQGSNLFGARPGQFVLLGADGTVGLRGSIVNDFERLRSLLQAM